MTVEELIDLYNAIIVMQSLKNKKNLIKYEFNKFLYDLQKDIKAEAEDYKNQLQLITDAKRDLGVEHADKDPETGEALYIDIKDETGNIVAQKIKGLNPGQKPEFDEGVKKLDEKKEDLFKTEVDFNPEKCDLKIKRKYLPVGIEDFTGLLQKEIQQFIEE